MPSPASASSAGTGGQVLAQSPSQFVLGGSAVSWSNRYRVRPRLSVTTLPTFSAVETDSLPAGLDGLEALGADGWPVAVPPAVPAVPEPMLP